MWQAHQMVPCMCRLVIGLAAVTTTSELCGALAELVLPEVHCAETLPLGCIRSIQGLAEMPHGTDFSLSFLGVCHCV